MNSNTDILIVGAGIIGLSTAVKLAERGAQVRVLDRGSIGFGCSYGNAGWMTPCFALPLPMPGLFFKSLKWLMNPESPLYIKPSLDPLLFKWLAHFTLSMSEKKARAATEALVALSKVSLELYEKLAVEHPEIGFEKKGLLMVAQSKVGVGAALQELDYVSRYAIPGRALSPDEIRNMEPSLQGHLEGGVYFPQEAHAEPLKVVKALAQKAQKLGVQIEENVDVTGWKIENGKIKNLQTSKGERTAETYVLATGSWSQAIAKELGLSIPILGGKGYALIVPPLQPQPRHPLMLIEKKIAITPRANSLRIAGTMELVNQDFSITERRVQAIIRGAREFLPVPMDLKIEETWRGLRPCTPDGVPLIGFSQKVENLALACGHQMLGLQSGFGTGQLLADLILTGKSDLDRKIYDPNRF
ncbi:MAG: NAD(P)/FAD-dependent oxidoreductase [Pseudobdellovibrionaceae bacterium]